MVLYFRESRNILPFPKVYRLMKRQRDKLIPQIPTEFSEIGPQIDNHLGLFNLFHLQFGKYDSEGIIISTPTLIRVLSDASTIITNRNSYMVCCIRNYF